MASENGRSKALPYAVVMPWMNRILSCAIASSLHSHAVCEETWLLSLLPSAASVSEHSESLKKQALDNKLGGGCGHSDWKRAVKEHPTFTPNCLSLGIWFAGFSICRPGVNESLGITGTWKPDVALLSPGFSPTVANQPTVFGIAHCLDTMIQNGAVVFAAAGENATSIQLPWSSCYRHRDRAFCCQCSLQSAGVIHWEPDVAASLHCCSVRLAGRISPFVRQIAFQGDPFGDGEVESQFHGGPFAAASSTTIMRIFDAIHVGLWRQC